MTVPHAGEVYIGTRHGNRDVLIKVTDAVVRHNLLEIEFVVEDEGKQPAVSGLFRWRGQNRVAASVSDWYSVWSLVDVPKGGLLREDVSSSDARTPDGS